MQSATLLLKGSHVPCLNHLAHSICPESLTKAAKTHDSQTRITFCRILGLDLIEDQKWHQVVLPIRLGGFGMTSLAAGSQPAFVASWCHATAELPLRFPSLIFAIDRFVISPRQALGKAFTQSISVGETVSSLLSSTEKIQHQLYTAIAKHEADQLISEAPTARDVARVCYSKGKGAVAWLNAIPSLEVFALDNHEFRLATFLRLGLFTQLSYWMTTCNCGATLDGSRCTIC